MTIRRVLIANRGEIAVRIARAAEELGVSSVAAHAADDAASGRGEADASVALPGNGPAAFLDRAALIDAARASNCDALHPGYGFLSESSIFAADCAAAGITFIGPGSETLALLGDKQKARALASSLGLPVMEAAPDAVDLDGAMAFLNGLPAGSGVALKAVAGGGGRGIRFVRSPAELQAAFKVCSAEAEAAFGDGRLIAERIAEDARHIEVQIVGDGEAVTHLWERDCTLQRRHQKLIEIAPAPFLAADLRDDILHAAVVLGQAVKYRGVGTVEFLVEPERKRFSFMEVNPRLQVEHTVTEAITGFDLVQAQFRLAGGASLRDIGLAPSIPAPRGYAVQLRLNAESVGRDGAVRSASGIIGRCRLPTGPGIRVDTAAAPQMPVDIRYDSLLAKIVASAPDFDLVLRRARAALRGTDIEGIPTNSSLLAAILDRPEVSAGRANTQFISRFVAELVGTAPEIADPAEDHSPEGLLVVRSPIAGVIVDLPLLEGATVRPTDPVAIIEAMKMQHVVTAETGGTVAALNVTLGQIVAENAPLLSIEPAPDLAPVLPLEAGASAPMRSELAQLLERNALVLDAARPESVARRHAAGKRTARENVADLCEPGSFQELGALTFAAQRLRRPVEELQRTTPADGMVAGLGLVKDEGHDTAPSQQVAVFAYDYTVMAGTQSLMNHKKLRRLLAIAEQRRLPVIGFVEGGGGRPGDVDDATRATGLDMTGFLQFARLPTPRIAIASGRCFAGNAVLAGCSDILLATRDTNLGMAGPAMVEGAGLGKVAPEAIGPAGEQAACGVVDLIVEDEEEATVAARRILSCLLSVRSTWSCQDQAAAHTIMPQDRRRAYDMRGVVDLLADTGSVTELRAAHSPSMLTALIRIEGRAIGLLANNPLYMAGAIDASSGEKAAAFLRLCDRFGLPVVTLCDTPGFMVGPDAERAGLVRSAAALFETAARLSVPLISVLVRRGYGLGAMAMTGGSFHAPQTTIAWPTGEFGGMGIEGAVRLGYKAELAAKTDQASRQALFDQLVAEAYERGRATSIAASLEIDAVIDPAETRGWIVAGLGRERPLPEATQR